MVAGKIVATSLTIYVYALRLMLFDLHALPKSYIALDDDTRPYAPSAIIYSIFSMLYIVQKKKKNELRSAFRENHLSKNYYVQPL